MRRKQLGRSKVYLISAINHPTNVTYVSVWAASSFGRFWFISKEIYFLKYSTGQSRIFHFNLLHWILSAFGCLYWPLIHCRYQESYSASPIQLGSCWWQTSRCHGRAADPDNPANRDQQYLWDSLPNNPYLTSHAVSGGAPSAYILESDTNRKVLSEFHELSKVTNRMLADRK